MYPLKEGHVYPRNHWYVAATSDEVGRGLLARRILGTRVVLYRTEAGEPVALNDMCAHRRFPLSKSKLLGDSIQCMYHGFTYNSSGKCTKLPTNDQVPENYGVQSFPVVERWQWIWIWMGDPELADPSKVPDQSLSKVQAEGWEAANIGMTTMKARYMILNENLLDLSHLTYLHEATIGSAGVAATSAKMESKDGYLEVTREIRGDSMEGVPLGRALGIDGPVNRLMVQQFFAPSFHTTGSAFSSAIEDGETPGKYYGGFRVLHAVTPETPYTTHYFYAFSRDFCLGDKLVGDNIANNIANALAEDIYASEQIEKMIDADADSRQDIHCRADAFALRGRLLIDRLIEAESRA